MYVGGRSMVLPKFWERMWRVQEGVREVKGRGCLISTYCFGVGRRRRCGGEVAEESEKVSVSIISSRSFAAGT